MTTTVRVTATTSADTSYTFNIAAGSTTAFGASGLGDLEEITIQKATSSGYEDLYYEDSEGNNRKAVLTWTKNTITLKGPLDGRINKPATAANVEVVEYS